MSMEPPPGALLEGAEYRALWPEPQPSGNDYADSVAHAEWEHRFREVNGMRTWERARVVGTWRDVRRQRGAAGEFARNAVMGVPVAGLPPGTAEKFEEQRAADAASRFVSPMRGHKRENQPKDDRADRVARALLEFLGMLPAPPSAPPDSGHPFSSVKRRR